MLSEQQVRDALHAGRVVPLPVPNPHGPLGLEQLVEAVARMRHTPAPTAAADPAPKVQRPLSLPPETWAKLDGLARAATRPGSPPLSASEVAAALIEQLVTAG